MLRFVCGFAIGVYTSKYYDFGPAIEYLECKFQQMEEQAKRKKK